MRFSPSDNLLSGVTFSEILLSISDLIQQTTYAGDRQTELSTQRRGVYVSRISVTSIIHLIAFSFQLPFFLNQDRFTFPFCFCYGGNSQDIYHLFHCSFIWLRLGIQSTQIVIRGLYKIKVGFTVKCAGDICVYV